MLHKRFFFQHSNIDLLSQYHTSWTVPKCPSKQIQIISFIWLIVAYAFNNHFDINRLSISLLILCAIRKFSSIIACFFFAFKPRISSRRRFLQLSMNSSLQSTTFVSRWRASSACEIVISFCSALGCRFAFADKFVFFVAESPFAEGCICLKFKWYCGCSCWLVCCDCNCSLIAFEWLSHFATGCRWTQLGSRHAKPLGQSFRRDSGCTNIQPNFTHAAPCLHGVWGGGQRIALSGISSGWLLSSNFTVTICPLKLTSLADIQAGSEGWRLQSTIVPGLSFNLISYAVIVVGSYSAAVRFGGTTCFAESGCRRWQPAVTQLLPIGQSFCRKGGCLNTHPNFLHRAPCRQSVIANGDVCVVSRNEWAFLRHICPVQGVFSRSIFSLIQLYISSSNLFCTATLIKFVWL